MNKNKVILSIVTIVCLLIFLGIHTFNNKEKKSIHTFEVKTSKIDFNSGLKSDSKLSYSPEQYVTKKINTVKPRVLNIRKLAPKKSSTEVETASATNLNEPHNIHNNSESNEFVTEFKTELIRLKQLSTNNLQTHLSDCLSRLNSNNPPTEMELRMLIAELRQRAPEDKELLMTDLSMDLNNQFSKDPKGLLEKAQSLRENYPNDERSTSLLMYAYLAQGFESYKKEVKKFVEQNPRDLQGQYSAVAIDLSNNQTQMAMNRLKYILSIDMANKKAKKTYHKLMGLAGKGPINPDEVMDWNPIVLIKEI